MSDTTQNRKASRYEVLDAMEYFGGGFASNLARAWRHADMLNAARLEQAFPDLLAKYQQMADLLVMQRKTPSDQ